MNSLHSLNPTRNPELGWHNWPPYEPNHYVKSYTEDGYYVACYEYAWDIRPSTIMKPALPQNEYCDRCQEWLDAQPKKPA